MSTTTLKLHIKKMNNRDLVETKSRNFTYAYQRTCNNIELYNDDGFIDWICKRFSLNDIEYRSVKAKAKAQMSAVQTFVEKKEVRVEELENELSITKDKKKRLKINQKIIKTKRSLKKGNSSLTFGSKARQRALTKECNKEKPDSGRVEKLRKELIESRKMPVWVIGEANQHGNRFFELRNLSENKAVYKPESGHKCEFEFDSGSKNQRDTLVLIEDAVKNNSIPVSCGLDQDFFYITFDTKDLHGYGVDEKSRRKAVKAIKEKKLKDKEAEKQMIKDVYRKFFDEQRERMLVGKISYIQAAIDLNPSGIGFVVCKFFADGTQKVLEARFYDFNKLAKRLNVSSDSDAQKRQNHKRTYETAYAYKDIFKRCIHHKVSVFTIEDLDMDVSEDMGEKDKASFRRFVNNIWNRNFQEQIIERRCAELGIELRRVNPVYSSFIGNLQWGFSDAANAAAEICRRGYYLYTKNSGRYPFPEITGEVVDTLDDRFGIAGPVHVAQSSTSRLTWRQLFQFSVDSCKDYKEFRHRGRTAVRDLPPGSHGRCRLKTVKSMTDVLIFNIFH